MTARPGTSPVQISRKIWTRVRRLILGLQGKLIIPYVLLTVLLAALGAYLITGLVTSSQRERFVNQLYEAARVVADNVVRREQFHLERLRILVHTQGVGRAIRDGDVLALNNALFQLVVNDNLDLVTIVDAQGRELISWALDPASKTYLTSQDQDFSKFPPVQKVLAGQSDALGDKFVGLRPSATGWMLMTAAPVYDENGKLVGAVAIGSRLSALLDETKSLALADVIALDLNYHTLAATLPAPDEGYAVIETLAQGADSENAEVKNLTLYGKPQRFLFVPLTLYGRDFRVVYIPWLVRQETIGWLGVILPGDFIVTVESISRNLFAGLFTIGTLVMIFVGYSVFRNIARPILRLHSMSQAVAAGDFSQRTGLTREDEIGELASAFDVMTVQLRDRTELAERLLAEATQRNKELAEINAKLQSMQLQLIQSEKLAAVGQLTAGIVHDVKNPLAVIKGLAEILQEDPGMSEETRRELKVIRESAEKGNRIVSDLLKFARQSEPQMRSQDLRETVEAALRLTAYLIREARVQLIKEVPDQMVLVSYDAQQIEQVLINLIHNAIQAMPNRGTLRVSLNQQDGMAVIGVQDTGTGISPENMKRIFDPFFTTKPEGQGTGLGLSVSYGIIANHNGQIKVESEVGKGTLFTIHLPADQLPVVGE